MAPPLFPSFAGIAWPIVRTPLQDTLIQTSVSGKQYRVPKKPGNQWKWTLNWGYLLDDQSYTWAQTNFAAQQLMGFFNSVQGQYGNFLYLDPWDNLQNTPIVIGTGDSINKQWGVFRVMFGALEYIQYINTISVFVNGVFQSSGVGFSNQPGIVFFTNPPANGASISCTFTWSFLCRFSKDTIDFSHDALGLWSVNGMEFESLLA